jgi:hypothetical protein
MSEFAVVVLIAAAIGGYVGSVYALKRSLRLMAPDATAQAYRDAITALHGLRIASLHVRDTSRPIWEDRDETWIAYDRAADQFAMVKATTKFLLSQADFDALSKVGDALGDLNPSIDDGPIKPIDKAIEVLERSAFRLFPRI